MNDQVLCVLTETMRGSRVAHALLDAVECSPMSVNEALEALIKDHQIITGRNLLGAYPDIHAQIRRCASEPCRSTYRHAPSSLLLELTPVRGEGGSVLAVQMIALADPAAEAQAKPLEKRFQQALEGFPLNAWMCTPNGELFWINHTSNQFSHGRPVVNDVSNTYWISKFHPDDLAKASKVLAQAMVDGVARPFRYRIRDCEGHYHWHLAQYAPIRDESGEIMYWVGAGIRIQSFVESEENLIAQIEAQKADHLSDKRRLRDANNLLESAQKMELVSNLAGGVAHDLNNLLFIMGMNAELLFKNLKNPIYKEYADGIRVNIKKAARLSSQLMGFSGRKPQSVSAVEPGKLMEELRDLLEKAVGAEAFLTIRVEEDVAPVLVDRMYLENSLINLAINARDAIAGRGTLMLSVANERVQRTGSPAQWLPHAQEGHGSARAGGDYVVFRMHDEGMGMSEDVQARIFEPFFTTKGPNKGTGLGLPMVKNFVENSGGFLNVKSELGVGTTISMYLPRSELIAADEGRQPGTVIEVGSESLLIIDDDIGVRNALANALYDVGYQNITTAYNCEYAIEFLGNGLKADVIISDVRMPGRMTTSQFLARLREMKNDVPVIFATGYSEDVVIEQGLVDGRHPVLFKPFTLEELFTQIRDAVQGRRRTEGSSPPVQ
jgi:signal transduction histidine kinase/CheY-like chemotaxis protein